VFPGVNAWAREKRSRKGEKTQSEARKEMVKVKICGITNLDDARVAIEAGADMLGFNFYRPSPRFIEPAEVKKIVESLRTEIEGRRLTMVGVFVNELSPDAVLNAVEEARLNAVQLHGDESIEFCATLKQLLNGKLLIKVLRVTNTFAPAETEKYDLDAIMLDAFHLELRGGTGRTVDWTVAQSARELVPRLFLAGGLSPENVAEAIVKVRPYAVDACSALESSPGRKDAERMRAFVQAVRNA
jgi:phosphoribosylanthranilate isomerase